MDDDDTLYSKLFGEVAPEEALDRRNSRQSEQKPQPRQASDQQGRGISSQPSTKSTSGTLGSLVPVKDKKSDFQDLANAEKEFDDEEDEDFDVKLDEPEPQDEDDLDLKLDDTDDAQAPFKGIPAVNSAEKPFRPSTFTAVRSNSQPGVPGIPAAVPGIPADATAAPRTTRPPSAPTSRPFVYPEYDPNDPGVLPSQASGPGQRIRLPGQTRVTPEEYREFLGLGHGDIFNLEIDWVVDAPWRTPGADPADYFNYGMNPRTWKEYQAKIKQYKDELTMHGAIQTHDYPGSRWGGDRDRKNGAASNERWAGDHATESSGRLALPAQEGQAREQSGGAQDRSNGSLPMPDMSGLPLPPSWDREKLTSLKQDSSSRHKRSKFDAG